MHFRESNLESYSDSVSLQWLHLEKGYIYWGPSKEPLVHSTSSPFCHTNTKLHTCTYSSEPPLEICLPAVYDTVIALGCKSFPNPFFQPHSLSQSCRKRETSDLSWGLYNRWPNMYFRYEWFKNKQRNKQYKSFLLGRFLLSFNCSAVDSRVISGLDTSMNKLFPHPSVLSLNI